MGGADINGFFPTFSNDRNKNPSSDINADFYNFIKGQYLTQNEHLYRNLSQNNKSFLQQQQVTMTSDDNNDTGMDDMHEERLREHAMRMEILKVELETAKIKKEIAEINKEMLLKQLNK